LKTLKKNIRWKVGTSSAARYLTAGLAGFYPDTDDASELMGRLADIVQARGGITTVSRKALINPLRLRLILTDYEEALRLLRLNGLLRALGLRLTIQPDTKK